MITSKNLVVDIKDVPQEWIFEHYAQLPEKLIGQEVRIKSLFNESDRHPSMYVFFSKQFKKYWFHDFSTGHSGDGIKLVMLLENISYGQACSNIRFAYKNYLDNPGVSLPVPRAPIGKYRVTDYVVRSWNVLDQGHWTAFNIGSRALDFYKVRPLDQFTMTREQHPDDQFTVWGEYIYGFFTNSGELYKIYRPHSRESKFIKVRDYLQGLEQLKDRKCLVISASLKDGLSLLSLNLQVDFVAPDSENQLLSEQVFQELHDRYQGRIVTLLDNDEAGIKAMQQYRKRYDVPPVLLRLAKDLSDSVKGFGPIPVRDRIVPRIDAILHVKNAA